MQFGCPNYNRIQLLLKSLVVLHLQKLNKPVPITPFV